MNNFEPFKIFFDRPGLFWFLSVGKSQFSWEIYNKTYQQNCYLWSKYVMLYKQKKIEHATLLPKEISKSVSPSFLNFSIVSLYWNNRISLKRLRDSNLNSSDLPNQIKTKLAKIWNFPRFLSILCLSDFRLDSLTGKLLEIISILRLLYHIVFLTPSYVFLTVLEDIVACRQST